MTWRSLTKQVPDLRLRGRSLVNHSGREFLHAFAPSRGGKRAGEGNRTPVSSLGSLCSTIELHPLHLTHYLSTATRKLNGVARRTGTSLAPGNVCSELRFAGKCSHDAPRCDASRYIVWTYPGLFGLSQLVRQSVSLRIGTDRPTDSATCRPGHPLCDRPH